MELIREEFKAWLDGKEPGARVGLRRTACDCPIATYLRQKTNRIYSVCGLDYGMSPYESAISTPAWARAFIHAVDNESSGSRTIVLAAQALNLLTRLP